MNVYYKKFLSTLIHLLYRYLNSITASNALPLEAVLAHVVVLPKSGKDLQHYTNYRPISLLNSDIKIFSKILMFALVLEHFLCMVRGREEISGICIGAVEHKVSAYADNLLFYLSDPRVSLAALMSEVDRYRLMSDFRINFE